MTSSRGTSNGNARGSVEDRRRRREWLVKTFRADMDLYVGVAPWNDETSFYWPSNDDWFDIGHSDPAWKRLSWRAIPLCRCYRCGTLLTADSLTVDRIVPGCKGGTYRRTNIRPACGPCNSSTGGALAHGH